MTAKPKYRAHVFYYPYDNYEGPTWTWCQEADGHIRDQAWDLPAHESWADAWAEAHAWLQRKYAPVTASSNLYGGDHR